MTTHRNSPKFPRRLNHFIRARAIANNIAWIPYGVIRGRGGKNRFDGR